MSMTLCERSTEPITVADLSHMAEVAVAKFSEFVRDNPRWDAYRERILAVALCQGAARHYLHGKGGIKDIDTWFFFAEMPGSRFPPRWRREVDFGPSKFGRGPEQKWTGRRMDLLGRSLPCMPNADPAEAIRAWLGHRRGSPKEIAKSPVILLQPSTRLGEVVWRGSPQDTAL